MTIRLLHHTVFLNFQPALIRSLRVLFGVAGVVLLAASASAQPPPPPIMQPGPPPGRVLLYPEPNFRGEPLEVPATAAFENLDTVRDSRGDSWNDRISSVRIEGPVILLVYEHSGFQGASVSLNQDVPDLNALSLGDRRGTTWDKCISSLRVAPAQVAPAQFSGPPFVQWNRHDAERAVRAAYRDLLGREPDERGLREYRDRLIARGWSEDLMRENFRRSPEYRSRDLNGIIRRTYRDLLRREPDPEAMAHYTHTLFNGMSEAELRADVMRTREYTELNARESVNRAYREILRREPDPAGFARYTKFMIEKGWDEGRVRDALRQSDEYRRLPKR